MRWLFNKKIGSTLICCLLLIIAASVINVVGIKVTGDIQAWSNWLQAHSSLFLGWRIILYSTVVCGWLWMRRRVINRESEVENMSQAKTRFLRVEISTICVLLVLELSNSLI